MSPATSVVVPVYNDPGGLEQTLASLTDQTAADYEVVVADNGSTDGTPAVARRFAERERVRHVVEDEVQSSYAARNAGVEAADGDIVGFLDADMWVDPDYVESITRLMTERDRDYAGCRVELVADDGTVARYRRATGFDVETYVREKRFAPTCCLVTRRRVFDAVGRFDGRLRSNGDLEFGRRVDAAGFDLDYAPDVTVYHPARSTLGDVLSQSARIGRGRAELRASHGDRFDVRHPLELRQFLPVNPLAFRTRLADAAADPAETAGWYLIACLQKWSMAAGHLREHAAASGEEPDPR
ncbi:glycosyltransferase [Halosimplex rubrum]|uniref:Glycosyltransferase n=1 Tax=Halosimplex rubrum TaxID=869889 RepID=A0A7D5P3R1_9EURY|nr:glycosyltransferase [Halosimplex rubrum]QLH76762.1 glycosyltransferase [Halosimplex rubrum]